MTLDFVKELLMTKGLEETPEKEQLEDLALLTDSAIAKMVVASKGQVYMAAKEIGCNPQALWRRINTTPALREMIMDMLESHCGVFLDRSIELIWKALERGDRGSEKLAVTLLDKMGILKRMGEKGESFFLGKGQRSSSPGAGDDSPTALSDWQKKLNESPRDEHGNIIVGGGEKDTEQQH